MKDVVDDFYTALAAYATAGSALESVADAVFANLYDERIDDRKTFPLIVLVPGGAVPRDVLRGSGHVVYTGAVEMLIVVMMDRESATAEDDAAETAETIRAALERCLRNLRAKVSATHPTGVWHHMTWEAGEGGATEFKEGAAALVGLPVYVLPVRSTFTFRRFRSAA